MASTSTSPGQTDAFADVDVDANDELVDIYARSNKTKNRVDRSAAAIAMNALRRAARKKTGPGPRERNEIQARAVERFGGVIEEDLSGESQKILEKRDDFGQSRSGDQWFHSEANSAIVGLQRALWYCDGIMRGVSMDARDNIQAERVSAAAHRLRHAIKLVQNLGVQASVVKRAQWLLHRFLQFSDDDRKVRREKKLEKLKRLIPKNWLEKTITRKQAVAKKEAERSTQIDDSLKSLQRITTSATLAPAKIATTRDFEENNIDHNKHSTVDRILIRRQRRLKALRERPAPTLRDVEAVAQHSRDNRRGARRLHRAIAHVVDRPPTPEDRYSESVYSDYEEYGRNLKEVEEMERMVREHNKRIEMEEAARIAQAEADPLGLKAPLENGLGQGVVDDRDEAGDGEEEYLAQDDDASSQISRDSSMMSFSQTRRKKKTKTLMSEHEVFAMRAETDFHEDVTTFLEGHGLVKNTGPISRLKFTANMKMKYLDLRMKGLRRTKIVVAVIKKMKDLLYKVLNGTYEEDELYGTAKMGQGNGLLLGGRGGSGGDRADDDGEPDLDQLLSAVSAEMGSNAHEKKAVEADLDIFKRWAGKKVVELEPLLSDSIDARKNVASNKTQDDDGGTGKRKKKGEEDGGAIWICRVCMKSNHENALVCVVCARPPDAPATKWGLAKHRPRRTHPRFMYTWNKKTGETIRKWEQDERERREAQMQSGKPLTLSESLKESFFSRAKEGGVLIP